MARKVFGCARRLERLRDNVILEVSRSQKRVADDMHRTLKERTSREFQEVPSYLRDPMSRTKYPSGVTPFFAKRARSIGRTPWVGRTQLYAKGNHLLRDMLESSQWMAHHTIGTDIGYRKGVGRGPTRFIVWVYFGTVKMQPRPFLQVALRGYRNRYWRSMQAAVKRAL